MSGVQVKKYDLSPGSDNIIIRAGEIQSGIYIYSLIVEGQKVGSKRMVLSN